MSYTLAEGFFNSAYGALIPYNYSADGDAYSLGILSPGNYTITGSGYNWDYSNIIFGSTPTLEVYNSSGTLRGTSYLGSIDLTVYSSETIYVAVKGTNYSSSEYQLYYTYDGPLLASNQVPTASNRITTINEDTPRTLSVADFGFSDSDVGDILQAVVVSAPTAGSLKLNGVSLTSSTAVTATELSSGNLTFSPAANATGTSYSSFYFGVYDGEAWSSSLLYRFSFNVTSVNDAPTLTSFFTTVTSGSEDAQLTVSLANLQTQGNETDIDGSVTSFVVKSISSGTLRIGTSAVTATAWTSGTNDGIDSAKFAYWTPAANDNGTLNAFTVVARDNNGATSSTSVQVKASVSAVRDDLTLTGTSGNDTLTGDKIDTGSYDTLSGLDGNDILSSLSGNDTLTGGAGDDNLNGGTGADTIVLNAVIGTSSNSSRVVVTGLNNDKGQDILTSFSLTEDTIRVVATNVASFVHGTDTTIGAGTGVEVAGKQASFSTATGLIELNQTNNNNWADAGDIAVTFAAPSTTLTEAGFEARLQYSLTGTTAANTLIGGALSDTLIGGAGNDSLTGSNGNDTLYGDAGGDLLFGGAGNDILYGGTEQDIFRFDTLLSSTSNVDQIMDFSVVDDTIQLENSIFIKFGTTTTGAINAAYFKANTTGLAVDSNDYIVYETDTGKLFYDADGNGTGASIQIALVGANLALTNADFVLF